MIIIICNLTTHSPSMFEKVIYIYHYTIIELFYMTRFIGKTEKLGGRWIKLFFERTYFYIAENGLLWCHNRVSLSCTRNGTKPSTAFFFNNNTGLQYTISWKNRTIQHRNFQNTVKSWEIQDKNPENITFAWKMKICKI